MPAQRNNHGVAMFEPHVQPEPDRENEMRSTGARIEIRPSERVAHLAVRSLACPSCDMPLALAGTVRWNESIACAFCEGRAPTRAYVRERGWPQVELIARLG